MTQRMMTSTDVSQLMQQQQAMFGNAAAYAQQIGMQAGTAPMGPAPPTYGMSGTTMDPRAGGLTGYLGPQAGAAAGPGMVTGGRESSARGKSWPGTDNG